jgi:hypothetical protein
MAELVEEDHDGQDEQEAGDRVKYHFRRIREVIDGKLQSAD